MSEHRIVVLLIFYALCIPPGRRIHITSFAGFLLALLYNSVDASAAAVYRDKRRRQQWDKANSKVAWMETGGDRGGAGRQWLSLRIDVVMQALWH